MPKPLSDRIAAIQEKQGRLAARVGVLQAKARTQARKNDTRRKIVVGGAVLVAMEKDPIFAQHIRTLLAQQVGRPIDREAIADLLAPSPAPAGVGYTVRYKQPAA